MNIPISEYPYYHRQELHVRFNDIDLFGHVNNTIYFQYMDFGKTQYIYDVMGDAFNWHREALVIVNVNCQYYNITLYDEPLEVFTRVDHISEHSITLDQRVCNRENGEVKCTCRTVMVGFDVADDSKMKIPEKWHRLISDFEHRKL